MLAYHLVPGVALEGADLVDGLVLDTLLEGQNLTVGRWHLAASAKVLPSNAWGKCLQVMSHVEHVGAGSPISSMALVASTAKKNLQTCAGVQFQSFMAHDVGFSVSPWVAVLCCACTPTWYTLAVVCCLMPHFSKELLASWPPAPSQPV